MSQTECTNQFEGEYTMGLSVENSTGHEHMTIAYLGKLDENKLKSIVFSHYMNFLPRYGMIKSEDLLGPKKDLPVWDINIDISNNRPSKNQEIYFSSVFTIFILWKVFNVAQEHTKGLIEPHLHITKKEKKRELGDLIEFDKFFIKRIGKYDPIFEKKILK
jgi:hypothetical protein